jgi:pimeloyl-ACP methyl ester carboxylesterase
MQRQDSRRRLERATLVPPLDERRAELKGVRLRYFVGGAGIPTVLVHGLGGAACNWRRLVPLLEARHRLVVPDLPGHGATPPLPALSGLDSFADRVALLIRREELGPALVVGHSLGALVALRLARRWPADVAGVVLAGAAGISSSDGRARRGLALTSLVKPGRRLAPYRRVLGSRTRLRRLVLGWGVADCDALGVAGAEQFLVGPALHTDTAAASRALVADDVRADLEGVCQPCLLLWGGRDTQVAVGDAFEFSRRLRAPLRVIADCGHLLIGERPDACADAITDFARRLPRQSDGIRQLDEEPLDPEAVGEVGGEGLDAEPLGRVVPSRDEVDPELA